MARVLIDERLVEQAMKLSGLPTKGAVAEAGLRLLIQAKSLAGAKRKRAASRY